MTFVIIHLFGGCIETVTGFKEWEQARAYANNEIINEYESLSEYDRALDSCSLDNEWELHEVE